MSHLLHIVFFLTFAPDNNGEQNADESYTNNYQNHIGCSYVYKLVCIADQFSKPFKSSLLG